MLKELGGLFVSAAGVSPALTAFVAVAFGVQWLYSHETYATKVELSRLEVKVDRRYLDQRIHDLESEIFSVERIIDEGNARQVDHQWLARLRSQLGSTKRELSTLDNVGS